MTNSVSLPTAAADGLIHRPFFRKPVSSTISIRFSTSKVTIYGWSSRQSVAVADGLVEPTGLLPGRSPADVTGRPKVRMGRFSRS
ncbi:hypothetical protein ACWC9X_18140 [Streptomyces asoensis]